MSKASMPSMVVTSSSIWRRCNHCFNRPKRIPWPMFVCAISQCPSTKQVRVRSGSHGAPALLHFEDGNGFWLKPRMESNIVVCQTLQGQQVCFCLGREGMAEHGSAAVSLVGRWPRTSWKAAVER